MNNHVIVSVCGVEQQVKMANLKSHLKLSSQYFSLTSYLGDNVIGYRPSKIQLVSNKGMQAHVDLKSGQNQDNSVG